MGNRLPVKKVADRIQHKSSLSVEHTDGEYSHVGDIFCALSDLWEPPERITVAEASAKYRYVNQPGAYIGPWENMTTPYMVEPMNTVTSRDKHGVIFVGPAQSGKTDGLIVNAGLVYGAKVDPMDTMIVCPTQTAARDFSIRRIDRLHRHSEEVGAMLVKGRDNDSVYSKSYINGMLVSLSWPTPAELAGKPIGRIFITDRDRMDDDVAGEGEVFDLASKRTTTFGSYAMTVCESSPSRSVTNNRWISSTPHEAPPCGGILSLYNRGDRRRWHWPCPSCERYFEGQFSMLEYTIEPGMSHYDIAETTVMVCPICSYKISGKDRSEMNLWGRWVKDGQAIDRKGRVFGPEQRNRIASFWLNGTAAAFVSWRQLVALYLDANNDFEKTGNEESLVKFYNNDLGLPYIPKSMAGLRLPETIKARAESLGERVVPEGVRFIVATVDVQKNQFVAQVFGILPGAPFDMVVIDRFEVRKSKRLDHDGERLWIKPDSYLEDWDELIDHVMKREYPLADGSGRMMAVRFVACDSGGKAGVTTMAYNFYRRLVKDNLHRRFILIKGDSTKGMPRTRTTFPDAGQKNIMSGPRGEIPVLLMQSNMLKDDLEGRLSCIVPGKGMFRTPQWLDDRFYAELCAETRTAKGWLNQSGHRNETWDLSYYAIGLCVSEYIRVEHIDWLNPPGWAQEWDRNDMIRSPDAAPRFTPQDQGPLDFAALAKRLA